MVLFKINYAIADNKVTIFGNDSVMGFSEINI
jgi:hypothetical protein